MQCRRSWKVFADLWHRDMDPEAAKATMTRSWMVSRTRDAPCQVIRVGLEWDSSAVVLAASSLHYLAPLHWPTHRVVSKETSSILSAAWLYARAMPRDMITLRNDRCTVCGWLTGQCFDGIELCYDCGNTSVCFLCTYNVPGPVSYTHLRAHETRHDLVCRLLLEKK